MESPLAPRGGIPMTKRSGSPLAPKGGMEWWE